MDAEDFDRAADLSARLDALNASVSRLADDLRAVEAECEFTSTHFIEAVLVCCVFRGHTAMCYIPGLSSKPCPSFACRFLARRCSGPAGFSMGTGCNGSAALGGRSAS